MALQYSDAVIHQLIVIRLIACRYPELFYSGLLSECNPDLGDKNPLKVKADYLHGSSLFIDSHLLRKLYVITLMGHLIPSLPFLIEITAIVPAF